MHKEDCCCALCYVFEVGAKFARLEHRVAELEKTLNGQLAKVAKDLTADADKTGAAVAANQPPGT